MAGSMGVTVAAVPVGASLVSKAMGWLLRGRSSCDRVEASAADAHRPVRPPTSGLDVPALATTLARLALRADGAHAPELSYAIREIVGELSTSESKALAHYQAWLTATVLGCLPGSDDFAVELLNVYERATAP